MTLNQVIASIKQYFKNHPLIEDVMVSLGDDDLNAVTGLKYPLVDIQYLDTDVVDKRFQHNLKIIIGDLTNPNVTGIDFEIYSDCLQIAGDFFQWLEDNFDFDYIRNTNVQPFTDSNVDRVSGVVFNIGIYTWLNGDIDCIDVTPSTTTTTTTSTTTTTTTLMATCECYTFVSNASVTRYFQVNRCDSTPSQFDLQVIQPGQTQKLCLRSENPYYDLASDVVATYCGTDCSFWNDTICNTCP
jgi:hypothetical protein